MSKQSAKVYYPSCHLCKLDIDHPYTFQRCQHNLCAECASTADRSLMWCPACIDGAEQQLLARVNHMNASFDRLLQESPGTRARYAKRIERLARQNPAAQVKSQLTYHVPASEALLAAHGDPTALGRGGKRKKGKKSLRCCPYGCCCLWGLWDAMLFVLATLRGVWREFVALVVALFVFNVLWQTLTWARPDTMAVVDRVLEDNNVVVGISAFLFAGSYVGVRGVRSIRDTFRQRGKNRRERRAARLAKMRNTALTTTHHQQQQQQQQQQQEEQEEDLNH